MKISSKITGQIKQIPEGIPFGYKDLDILSSQYISAAKVLERLQKKGVIKKVSNGKFYKPKQTVFGELKPSEAELLKPYLFENGKRIAYVTGAYLYNQMGLTRQVAAKIKIASRVKRIYINTGSLKATPVKSYAEVTNTNYQQLSFLDALKDINNIPDLDPKDSVVILTNLLKKMPPKAIKSLVNYALAYPPRVRALLGALLEINQSSAFLNSLNKSLNPFTKYKTRITKAIPTASNWNLI